MLSDLDIKHRLELSMIGAGTLTPFTYDLDFLGSPEFPWQLKNVSGILLTGPPINFLNVAVNDENGNLIINISTQPWVAGGSAGLINSNQTPDVPFVSFFGTIIVGTPADLYVYSNWTLTISLLNPVAGSGYNLNAIFMQGFFRDKYRLSA